MPRPNATPSTSTHGGSSRRSDKARELQQAIEDAGKSDGRDRDLEHGEGGTLGLPRKPADLSHDD
ncbi:hypothetical protein [Bradyrhizobium sp. STM 3557]|uniref:hypothetical protein n=1 Tax=Bradyrhizobium sp. STM 3557 TaxID=578920 RepID=UPI00388FB55A